MTRKDNSASGAIDSVFAARVLFVGAVAVLVLIAWQLMDLFLLIFGAIIVATALRAFASKLENYLHVPSR